MVELILKWNRRTVGVISYINRLMCHAIESENSDLLENNIKSVSALPVSHSAPLQSCIPLFALQTPYRVTQPGTHRHTNKCIRRKGFFFVKIGQDLGVAKLLARVAHSYCLYESGYFDWQGEIRRIVYTMFKKSFWLIVTEVNWWSFVTM